MKRIVAGTLVAATALSCATGATAARDPWTPGAAAAMGVIGGLAVGSAIAVGAQPYYVPPPVYAEPVRRVYPAYETCYVERYRAWVPGWGWEHRRRTVCD